MYKLWGVFCDNLEKIDHVIMAQHCTKKYETSSIEPYRDIWSGTLASLVTVVAMRCHMVPSMVWAMACIEPSNYLNQFRSLGTNFSEI